MKQLSVILFLLYLLNPITSWGNDAEKSFLGFWESQEAAGDTCVLNVKRGGRISCFWTESASKAVAKGHWQITEGKLIATWDSGYIDILTPQGSDTAMRQVFSPGQSLDQPPTHESLATKVDPRIPGSLVAKPKKAEAINPENNPKEPDAIYIEPKSAPVKVMPEIPARNPFTGFWKIPQSTGGFLGIGSSSDSDVFYLSLDRSGKANLSLRNWDGGNPLGTWEIVGNEARITWSSGHKDILKQNGDSMSFTSLSSKQDFSASPSNSRNADRLSPEEANQYFSAGEVRMLTTVDIRGQWFEIKSHKDLHQDDNAFLEIEPWGNASRHENGTTTKGTWKLFTNYVILNWEDGSKDVLRASFKGWSRESFSPGTAVTGRPYQTFPIAKKQ